MACFGRVCLGVFVRTSREASRHIVSMTKLGEEEFMHGIVRTLVSTGAVLVLTVGATQAAEVKVLITGALQNAVRALGADYEKQSGNKVTITATNPALVVSRMVRQWINWKCI
jgi:hypothetical protein